MFRRLLHRSALRFRRSAFSTSTPANPVSPPSPPPTPRKSGLLVGLGLGLLGGGAAVWLAHDWIESQQHEQQRRVINHYDQAPPTSDKSIPDWVHTELARPEWTPISTVRLQKHHLVRDTLSRPGCIEAFYFRVKQPNGAPFPVPQGHPIPNFADKNDLPHCLAVLKLGPNLQGHPGLVHGGLSATVLDSILGMVSGSVHRGNMTAYLNINYRKPVVCNTWVLVRARISKVEGRKIFIDGSIEDGKGNVLVDANSLFIMVNEKHLKPQQQ